MKNRSYLYSALVVAFLSFAAQAQQGVRYEIQPGKPVSLDVNYMKRPKPVLTIPMYYEQVKHDPGFSFLGRSVTESYTDDGSRFVLNEDSQTITEAYTKKELFKGNASMPKITSMVVNPKTKEVYACSSKAIYKVGENNALNLVAGNSRIGYANGNGSNATFTDIQKPFFYDDAIYILERQSADFATNLVEYVNILIRKVTKNGQVSTLLAVKTNYTKKNWQVKPSWTSIDGDLSTARVGLITDFIIDSGGDVILLESGMSGIGKCLRVANYSASLLGRLPEGLVFDKRNLVITGSIKQPTDLREYQLTLSDPLSGVVRGAFHFITPIEFSYESSELVFQQGVKMTYKPKSNFPVNTFTSFSITPSLPSGFSLNRYSGEISGQAYTEIPKGKQYYTVTAERVNGGAASFRFNLSTINRPVFIKLQEGRDSVMVNGGTYVDLKDIFYGKLDLKPNFKAAGLEGTGLAINPVTGHISGTATMNFSPRKCTIYAFVPGGESSVEFTLYSPYIRPEVYYQPVNLAKTNELIKITPRVLYLGEYPTFEISPALPSGLRLNKTTGEITGVAISPVVAMTYTVTIKNDTGFPTNVKFSLAILKNSVPNISTDKTSYKFISNQKITGFTIKSNENKVPELLYGFSDLNRQSHGVAVAIDAEGYVYQANRYNEIVKYRLTRFDDPIVLVDGKKPSFKEISGLAVDAQGNVYAADSGNNCIHKITKEGGISIFAGNGDAGFVNGKKDRQASFNRPSGLAFDAEGTLYVADAGNNAIRKISKDGNVTTFLRGVTGDSFNDPQGIATDYNGDVYLADTGNGMVRKITKEGVLIKSYILESRFVSTVGPGGKRQISAVLPRPVAIGVNKYGIVYVLDSANEIVNKITNDDVVTTLAGGGLTTRIVHDPDEFMGVGEKAKFFKPKDLVVNSEGNVIVVQSDPDKRHSYVRIIYTEGGYSISPDLPDGLKLDDTGTISGFAKEPLPAKTYTITAYNEFGKSNDWPITIEVVEGLKISYPFTEVNITKDVDLKALKPRVSNAEKAIYSISPALPAGLVFNSSTGEITGKPSKSVAMTSYQVTLSNDLGSATFSFKLSIGSAPEIELGQESIEFEVGKAIEINTIWAAEQEGVTYSIFPALPLGLVWNSKTATISGTPQTITQAINYSITATNPYGASKVAINLSTSYPRVDYYPDMVDLNLNEEVNIKPTLQDTDGYTFSTESPLPEGLTINPTTGVITGKITDKRVLDGKSRLRILMKDKVRGLMFEENMKPNMKPKIYFVQDGEKYNVVKYTFYKGTEVKHPVKVDNSGGEIPRMEFGLVQTHTTIDGSDRKNEIVLHDGNIFQLERGNVNRFSIRGKIESFLPLNNKFLQNPFFYELPTKGNAKYRIRIFTEELDSYLDVNYYKEEDGTNHATAGKWILDPEKAVLGGLKIEPYGYNPSVSDSNGNFYILDVSEKRILRHRPDNPPVHFEVAYDRNSPGGDLFEAPFDMTLDKNGILYVSDLGKYGTNNQKLIHMFEIKNQNQQLTRRVYASRNDIPGIETIKIPEKVQPGYMAHNFTQLFYTDEQTLSDIHMLSGGKNYNITSYLKTKLENYKVGGLLISPLEEGKLKIINANKNKYRARVNIMGYGITPRLPNGLRLTDYGEIVGTPTEPMPTTVFTITAFNPDGVSNDISLTLTVLEEPAFRYEKKVYYLPRINGLIVPVINQRLREGKNVFSITPKVVNNDIFFQSEGGLLAGSIRYYKNQPVEFKTYTVTMTHTGISQNGKIPDPVAYTTTITLGTGTPAEIEQLEDKKMIVNEVDEIPINVQGYQQVLTHGATRGWGFNNPPNRVLTPGSLSSSFESVALDSRGNSYVSDSKNHVIYQIEPSGNKTIFAGSFGKPGFADEEGEKAKFNRPMGIAIDALDNIYVADKNNHRIRKITYYKDVSTYAGNGDYYWVLNGKGQSASFSNPEGVAVDGMGNVYVADTGNHRIRKIDRDTVVTTIAGSGLKQLNDGWEENASFHSPTGIGVDGYGNVYVADRGNKRIRKIDLDGKVTSLAGGGAQTNTIAKTGADAKFENPINIAVNRYGVVYVADAGLHMIREILEDGSVRVLSGNGTQGSTNGDRGESSTFDTPSGLALDHEGNLLVADTQVGHVRSISILGYHITPTLPKGLKLNVEKPSIEGTPVEKMETTTYTLTAYNLYGKSNDASVRIKVIARPTIKYRIEHAFYMKNQPIAPLYPKVTETKEAIFSISPALPAGLSLDPHTGVISGKPRESTRNTHVISLKNEEDLTAVTYLSISIGEPPLLVPDPKIINPLNPLFIVPLTAPIVSWAILNSGGAVATEKIGKKLVVDFFTGVADIVKGNMGLAQQTGKANMYMLNTENNVIYQVTPEGELSVFAGSGKPGLVNAKGAAASFSNPTGLT
ncbi:MAG: putative Ig domain-containing protein, partial [Sphingobacteriaceae bacterium]|nr:putative Ig domain-containing protein [Sphingobacteriaceae bacterium]